MVKLVEEVVISPDVLVDVLVQVGFLDKAFEDGKVTNVDYIPSLRGESTYSITVEKEVSLKDIKSEKKELPTSTTNGLIGTPYSKITTATSGETVLNKKDAEKLFKNIHVSDKLTTNIADILNNAWKTGNASSEQIKNAKEVSNENDEGRNEVDERDDLDKIVDLLAYLKESVDILNAERWNAEKFAKEFINKVNTIKCRF